MKKNNCGFTLIETSMAVAVAAVLAAVSVPQYNIHVAKSQLSESVSLMDAAKPETTAALVKKGLCTADGKKLTVDGNYGVLVVSGTVNQTAVKNSKVRMATGCVFTYTVNASGVSKLIAGKKVVADLFNNGTLSRNALTTADDKLVPKALKLIAEDSAGSKVTPTVPGGPSITNPGNNVGPAITPSTPAASDPATPPAASDPATPPIANEVIDLGKKPDLVAEVVGGYKVIPSINVTDIVKNLPSVPPKIVLEIPSDVAVIGFVDKSHNTPASGAIVVDTQWPAGVDLTIVNRGIIAGGGGDGGGFINSSGQYCQGGKNGGTGIYNLSAYTIVIENYGTVSGGGGGGGCGLRGARAGVNIQAGGGGAPFGKGGIVRYGFGSVGNSASLLTAGAGLSLSGGGGLIGTSGSSGSTNDGRMGTFTGGSQAQRFRDL